MSIRVGARACENEGEVVSLAYLWRETPIQAPVVLSYFLQLAYGFKHSSTLLCYISWSSGYRQIQILKSDHLVGQSPSNTGVGSSHLRGQPPPPAFTASVLGEHWNHLSTALLCMSTYCCLSNETQLSSSIHLKGRFEGTFPSASESQNNLFLFVLRAEML